MSYESDCLTWVDTVYRPMMASGGHPNWPTAPAVGSDGAQCATWVDDGYRPWYDAHPDESGGTGLHKRPPQPPKKD